MWQIEDRQKRSFIFISFVIFIPLVAKVIEEVYRFSHLINLSLISFSAAGERKRIGSGGFFDHSEDGRISTLSFDSTAQLPTAKVDRGEVGRFWRSNAMLRKNAGQADSRAQSASQVRS